MVHHQKTSSQLDTTVGSIGVNMGQHPCGTLSTPCKVMPRQIEAVLRAKVWETVCGGVRRCNLILGRCSLMLCTLSVFIVNNKDNIAPSVDQSSERLWNHEQQFVRYVRLRPPDLPQRFFSQEARMFAEQNKTSRNSCRVYRHPPNKQKLTL